MLKQKAYRSKKYLAFVRTFPCMRCGDPKTVAHHIIGIGALGGMAIKPPDNYTMPLCHICHVEIHAIPELWQEQWEWIARIQAKWIEHGS